jgi:hypothetical protein
MALNSDNYSFAKSQAPQGVDMYTPFSSKNWYNIPDINSGVYSTQGPSQVQFDLTSIMSSADFVDASELLLTIPVTMAAVFTTAAGVTVAPVANVGGLSSLMTLKPNFQTLIHQVELVASGKTINDNQSFISQFTGFRLLSQMSTNDLKQWGPTLGFGDVIESEKSVVWSPVAGAYSPQAGVGLTNNRAFLGPLASGVGVENQSYIAATGNNTGAVNSGLARRMNRIVDTSTLVSAATSAGSWNKIYGTGAGANGITIMTPTQVAAESRPYFSQVGNYMYWTELAVVPLKHLIDAVDKLGLVKKLDLQLRFYCNVGSMVIPVANPNLTTTQYGAPLQSTFTHTCPFTVNLLNATEAAGGIPATTTNIVCGCFIKNVPTTSIVIGAGSVNLNGGAAPAHFMPSCRVYYPLIQLPAAREEEYILANRAKQIVHESFITNIYQVGSGTTSGNFSQLIQSGIRNPIALVLIPLISGTTPATAGGAAIGFEQYQSPFDMNGGGGGYSPVSLTNLQVQLGGKNVLEGQSLYTSWENFIEQVGIAESLTSTDLGVGGVGVISEAWWTQNRVYYVDLARGKDSDKASMRNLTVSFTNNSNVNLTLLCFTVYLDKFTVDVLTGQVTK